MTEQHQTTTERLWSINEAARYLGIPLSTLYQWRAKGYGPQGRRIGRYIKYFPEEVRSWASNQPEAIS